MEVVLGELPRVSEMPDQPFLGELPRTRKAIHPKKAGQASR